MCFCVCVYRSLLHINYKVLEAAVQLLGVFCAKMHKQIKNNCCCCCCSTNKTKRTVVAVAAALENVTQLLSRKHEGFSL